jgi:hypothetical protein
MTQLLDLDLDLTSTDVPLKVEKQSGDNFMWARVFGTGMSLMVTLTLAKGLWCKL